MVSEIALPSYNRKRAAQAAAAFLRLEGGKTDRLKLTKLLYNLDREALRRWGRTVTFDRYFSMPHGLIGSASLDRIRNKAYDDYWDSFIITRGYNVVISGGEECPTDELSRAERALILELSEKYINSTGKDMENEHKKDFREYERVRYGRRPVAHEKLLEILGFTDSQIAEFFKDMALLDVIKSAA